MLPEKDSFILLSPVDGEGNTTEQGSNLSVPEERDIFTVHEAVTEGGHSQVLLGPQWFFYVLLLKYIEKCREAEPQG